MESLLNKITDIATKLETGEAWLKSRPRSDPRYAEAERRVAEHRRNLAAAEDEWKRLVAEERGWAWDESAAGKPASLNCTVCGLPVGGKGVDLSDGLPGHRVHFNCMVK